MATIVNNPAVERERIVESSDSSAGWAIAVIVLLVVLAVGAYIWANRSIPAQQQQPGANIQVNLPSAGTQPTDSSGGTGSTQPQTQTTPTQ